MESSDFGRSWELLGTVPLFEGTVDGYRREPYGERAMISRDGGASWEYDYILRDDGPDSDLGYPSSVELADGSILTAYYQKLARVEDKCGFLWTRWDLPAP